MLAGMQIQNFATANSNDRRIISDNIPISRKRDDGRLAAKLDVGAFAGKQIFTVEKHNSGKDFACAVMQADAAAILERAFRVGCEFQNGIQHIRRREQFRHAQNIAPLNRPFFDAMQVERRALPGVCSFDRRVVHLNVANPRGDALRQNFNRLLLFHNAGNQRAGHDRAKSFDRKHAINRKTQDAICSAFLHLSGNVGERLTQRSESLTGFRGDRQNRRILQKRAFQPFAHVFRHHVHPLGIHKVGFRQCHDAARNLKQITNGKMLFGLRHDPFISRNHEDRQVNAADAGQHVFDEFFMPRHVNNGGVNLRRERQKRKTNINRDAALLLFF